MEDATQPDGGSSLLTHDRDEDPVGLSDVDDAIAAALALGLSYAEAGQAVGRSGRTVARRVADPTFARLVDDRRREHLSAVTARLAGLAPRAIEAIETCLDEGRPTDRLRASQLVLSMTLRFAHLQQLAADVADIKRELAAMKGERQ